MEQNPSESQPRLQKLISFARTQNSQTKQTVNPQQQSHSQDSRNNTNTVFLTQFKKTKYEQSQPKIIKQKSTSVLKPIKLKKHKKLLTQISSWKDLDKLKIKYRTQLLKRKSIQEIFQQNIMLIQKIQQQPPKVETWNYQYKPKKISRISSIQDLFEKNLQIIKKIEQQPPKVQSWNYQYKPSKKSPRAAQRKQQQWKIFEQNMKIIQRVQTTPPKVQSWSQRKFTKKRNLSKKFLLQKQKRNDKIFQQNMKIIQRVEAIPPKVQDWTDIKALKNKYIKNKAYNDKSALNLLIMKKKIQQQQQKLRKKQSQFKLNQLKRYKTLPNRLPAKLRNINEQNDKNKKRLTSRIQGIKCSIDCWSKPPPMKFNISPSKNNINNLHLNLNLNLNKNNNKNLTIGQQNARKNGIVLSLVKQIKQIKHMQRNQQIKQLKIINNPNNVNIVNKL